MLSFPVKRALPVSSARVLFRLRAGAVTSGERPQSRRGVSVVLPLFISSKKGDFHHAQMIPFSRTRAFAAFNRQALFGLSVRTGSCAVFSSSGTCRFRALMAHGHAEGRLARALYPHAGIFVRHPLRAATRSGFFVPSGFARIWRVSRHKGERRSHADHRKPDHHPSQRPFRPH